LAGLLSTIEQIESGISIAVVAAGVYSVVKALNSNNYTTSNPAGQNYINSQTLIFPSDLIDANDNRVTYMIFNFYKYQRPSIYGVASQAGIGSVILPLPGTLVDNQSESYKPGEILGPGLGAAMDAASTGISGDIAKGNFNAVKALNGAVEALGTAAGGRVVNNFLSTVTGGLGLQNVLQLEGLTVNPFMTVLYDSPTYKRHAFTWTFIPKNIQEANTIKLIANKFKYHQAPDLSSAIGGTLLRYPDMVVPVISPAGYVYSFKHCMIEDSSVNYAPGATPSFTTAFSPSALQLTIKLLEIEYWTKQDYLTNDVNYSIPTNISTTSITGITTIPTITNVVPTAPTDNDTYKLEIIE
jgi:hypothetical protein